MEEHLAEVSNASSQQKWRYGSCKVSIASEGLVENEFQCIKYNELTQRGSLSFLVNFCYLSNFWYLLAVILPILFVLGRSPLLPIELSHHSPTLMHPFALKFS